MEEGNLPEDGGTGNGHDPAGEDVAFAVRTLRGDVRDALLDLVRHLPKQWQALSEAEQRTAARRLDETVTEYLTEATSLIAAEGRVTITGVLKDVKTGDKGIEGKVVIPRYDEHRHLFQDCQGSSVIVVVAAATKFMGERHPARIDPQEPPLPLETLELDPTAPPPVSGDDDGDSEGPGSGAEDPLSGPREMGRQARRHGIAREQQSLFEPDSPEASAWLEGWDEGSAESVDDPADDEGSQPRRRGRPRKEPPADNPTA